jgi:RHS repeat-associated protein
MTLKSGNGSGSYAWDYENRLSSMMNENLDTATYTYDALGRRVSENISSWLHGNSDIKFMYDGQDVMLDDSLGSLTKYQNAPGIDNKLSQNNYAGTQYFIQDHLGSTVGLADSSGSLTAQTNYDSFGNATNSYFPTRYQFTGREYQGLFGLQYSRARWYDPNLGRFISEDPSGFAGGDINLYGYVWNNPLGFTDPTGLDGWGNDAADWLDSNINYARGVYKADPAYWGWNGTVDTVADLSSLAIDPLRVGSGLGYAIYDPDASGWQRAGAIGSDALRAAAIYAAAGKALGGAVSALGKLGRTGEAIKACPMRGRFPSNPDDLLPELPRNAKGQIFPSDNIRIRPEQHPVKAGETYNPRHHGQHYHVDQRLDPNRSWGAKGNVIKIKPQGYTPGDGTGFLPGEEFPGY